MLSIFFIIIISNCKQYNTNIMKKQQHIQNTDDTNRLFLCLLYCGP